LQCGGGKWSEDKADFLEQLFAKEKLDEKVRFCAVEKLLLRSAQALFLLQSVKEQVQNLRGSSVDVQLMIYTTLLCKQRTLHLLAVSLIQHQLKVYLLSSAGLPQPSLLFFSFFFSLAR